MPAFSITPLRGNTPPAPDDAPLGVQFQRAGENVGDRSFDTINVTGGLIATRGTGAESNVITLSLPEPSKPPGWMTDIIDSGSVPLHANSGIGTYQDFITPPGVTIQHEVYAGVEGYAGETVVWGYTWEPTVSDPAPTITPMSGGRVEVYWDTIGGGWPKTSQGILTLSVTVNGALSADTIEFVSGVGGDYTQMTWGPTP